MGKLIRHCHAIEAVDVASVPYDIVRVWKPIIHCLLFHRIGLLYNLLLLREFILQNLCVFCSILFDLSLRF